ncbi:hypothetical protein BGW41_003857 [Actinomortierella wolfii]|nr:hypothetical protein BGW41_003857 [Actinomortierella wolfii]
MTMTENIQKKLSGLEEAIEKLELDAEVVQFADWKKERVNELDRYMDAKRKEMWDKAELLAARSQEYQREESQRRLKMIEEQFASDMDEFRRRKMAEEAKLFGPIGEDDGYDNGSMGEYADHATFRDRRSSSSSSSIGMPGLMTPKELAATTKGFFERLSGTLSTTSLGHFPTSNSGSSRSSMADVLGTAPGGPMPSLPTIPSQVRRSTGASSASTAMRDSVLFIDNVPTEEADQEALNQFLGSEDSGSSDGEEQAGADQQRSKHLTVSLGKTVGDDDGENSSDGGVELVPEEDIEGVDETSEDEEDEEEDDDEEEDEEEESEESDSEDDGMDPITRARLAKLGMGHGHKSGSTIAVFALANASKTQLPS